jgi:hypothetical protein
MEAFIFIQVDVGWGKEDLRFRGHFDLRLLALRLLPGKPVGEPSAGHLERFTWLNCSLHSHGEFPLRTGMINLINRMSVSGNYLY